MDWNMIRTLVVIGLAMINGLFFAVIKFNDLKHLSNDVKDMKSKVGELAERISTLEGICSVFAKKKKRIKR